MQKASAFERKQAIKKLEFDIKNLDDRNRVEKIVNEKFGFVDFERQMMKNSQNKFTHFIKSKSKFIDSILKRQKQIGECFLKHQKAIHEKEDLDFLENMSDVLDLRNWNISAFDPALDENEKDESIQKEIEKMVKKLQSSEEFYEDLEKKAVESELQKVLRMIYENERECEVLTNARKEKHIIDQWQYLGKRIPFLSKHE